MGPIFSVGREERTDPDVECVFQRYRSVDFGRATLRQTVDAAMREFDVAC